VCGGAGALGGASLYDNSVGGIRKGWGWSFAYVRTGLAMAREAATAADLLQVLRGNRPTQGGDQATRDGLTAVFRFLDFERDQPPGARDGGMIGAAFIEPDSEEVADAQGIGRAPSDAVFGIDAFEIANQEGAEVDGWG
jgi:hypothetical protein